MKSMPKSPSYTVLAFCFWCIHLLCSVEQSTAQTTDPSEAAALNSIFQQWNISATSDWNKSGELCSGVALGGIDNVNPEVNPRIECQCTFNNGSICHITKLKVFFQNVTGHIPETIGNLTHLNYLDLSGNYFTGSLPSSIGKLRSMQFMSSMHVDAIEGPIENAHKIAFLSANLLSESIPKELGNLRNLTELYLGTNSFNGSLPEEMGNLVNLKVINMDGNGVSGPIPPTFANLVNLERLWAFDNELNGTIPDFIGNWTKLKILRLYGNAFQGPIPSSLSSLASLTDLQIGEITSKSSSLAFIKGMRNLKTLIVRNSKISGRIPFDIGEYQSLEHLDLSFNNLTGEIPSSLFNMNSLSSLFLGNNSLLGNLPSNKSDSLLYIDLSYNQLSGSLPSWITQGLQLNLVANNFNIDSINNSTFPLGWNCLQRNFSCYQDSLTNSSFAINCGGDEYISGDGMSYDSDVNDLGIASYYLVNSTRLAVSNVGVAVSTDGLLDIRETNKYTTSSQSQFRNTLDPNLFRTTRTSQGSLRYYKLGLVNGQYKVTLQFAEIQLDSGSIVRHGLGRRVFDIFIQGNLQLKDFDIRKEAGGMSNSAVLKTFKVNVSKNFIEIHLFRAGKGIHLVGPSISAINVTPDFPPTFSNRAPTSSGKKNKTSLVVGIIVGVVALIFISISAIFFWKQRSRGIHEDEGYTFRWKDSSAKKLSVASHHGKSQFVTEIVTISAVQHRNLVKLYGCCIEGDERILVYEYLENKSLDHALYGDGKLHLNWPTRYSICLSTARGLTYLHEESRLRIIHRDVKASNILLDVDLNPKISDFGLAKLYDDKKTHISTRVAGTIGYLAPEYAMRGHLTEKADVFGFGVVALEILSGRPNTDTGLDQDKIYLLEWAWTLYEANRPLEPIDPTLSEFDNGEALRMIGVALLCTQTSPVLRPPMSRVVAMLSGDVEVSSVISRPSYLTLWQFDDLTNSLSDYMSRGSMGITTEGQCDILNNSSWSTPEECSLGPLSHFCKRSLEKDRADGLF